MCKGSRMRLGRPLPIAIGTMVLMALFFMLAPASAAEPRPVAPTTAIESRPVPELTKQAWQFLLDTPHRAKGSRGSQIGMTALFFIFATILPVLGGGAFGARRTAPALIFGVFFCGAFLLAVVVYGGFAPFVVVPWGLFIFVKGFRSGRRSPEKWFYSIHPSETAPTPEVKSRPWFPPVTARDLRQSPVIALVLSNLLPIGGVLALGWDVFPLLMLYWMENVVIGFYNVLRMVGCTGAGNIEPPSAKWFLIPFFCGHFGLFCAVHGFVLFFAFGSQAVGLGDRFPASELFGQLLTRYQLGWSLLGLVISHGVSFVRDYLIGGERRRTAFGALLYQPYVRVFGMHVVVGLGAAALVTFHAPGFALVLLVLLKLVLDLRAHLLERAKLGTGQ